MKFGSLFAGIGGIDLGLERAGMKCIWQVEIDEYCSSVLQKHWPDVKRYGDVREVGKHNLETVDLIVGGFPCQPHSVAGKRGGAEDNRNLWPEFSRIIAEARPRYVLAENVPGIITTYLDTVLSDLESQGYACWTFNLPAVAFDAPHRRERIFIVAYAIRSIEQSRSGRRRIRQSNQNVADTNSQHSKKYKRWHQLQEESREESFRWSNSLARGQWKVEPDVGRVAHGVPARVDRLRGLGNAVVPQVAEWIGRNILDADKAC